MNASRYNLLTRLLRCSAKSAGLSRFMEIRAAAGLSFPDGVCDQLRNAFVKEVGPFHRDPALSARYKITFV
jgi:hypothetical protein